MEERRSKGILKRRSRAYISAVQASDYPERAKRKTAVRPSVHGESTRENSPPSGEKPAKENERNGRSRERKDRVEREGRPTLGRRRRGQACRFGDSLTQPDGRPFISFYNTFLRDLGLLTFGTQHAGDCLSLGQTESRECKSYNIPSGLVAYHS